MRRIIVHNHFRVRDSGSALSFESAQAFRKAEEIDPLGYLRGLTRVESLPDTDNWNAHYDFSNDVIGVQAKFEKKRFADKVQTFLHEAGHRGEAKDSEAWRAFNAAGLGGVKHFLAMCNRTHREDYNKNGIDNPTQEAFAESYARWALNWRMPEEIRKFWDARKASARDAYDPANRGYTGREPVAGAIKNHPGVQEAEISGDSDYKYEVFLKEGWEWQRGRNAGGCTGFFHNVGEFRHANPVRSGARDAHDSDLRDGTLRGWPVSLLIERDAGGKSYGAHCAAYTDDNDKSAPHDIAALCHQITDACYGLPPAKALAKAKAMGFRPD